MYDFLSYSKHIKQIKSIIKHSSLTVPAFNILESFLQFFMQWLNTLVLQNGETLSAIYITSNEILKCVIQYNNNMFHA
jgi:hypothetical protein